MKAMRKLKHDRLDRRCEITLRSEVVCVVVSRKLRRLMRENDLQPKRRRRYVVTTDSDHTGLIYPGLANNFVPERPNQLWVADLTMSPSRAASSTWLRSWLPGRARWSATRSAD